MFKRFYANKNKPYTITYAQLKEWVGITTKTTSNNSVISNIMTVLQKLGLIDYELINRGGGFMCLIKNVNLTMC